MQEIPNNPPPYSRIFGTKRVSFLGPRFIRLEYSPSAEFDDRPTLTVVNRNVAPVSIDERRKGDTLVLTSGPLTVSLRDDSNPLSEANVAVEFEMHGSRQRWHPGMQDPANLGGTLRTLDKCDGSILHPDGPDGRYEQETLPPGLLSRIGWSVVDESLAVPLGRQDGRYWVTPRSQAEAQDLYFLGYGLDYKGLLRDAALVFGQQPLPPRFAFGYWWSRYWAYMDWELEQIVEECDRQEIPLDVLVIDMDWHQQGWTGFSWDRGYFPDPGEFLAWARRRHLHVSMNLHPADGFGAHEDCYPNVAQLLSLPSDGKDTVPFESTDPVLMAAYFKQVLKGYEEQGIEFWWMDWQQGTTCRIPYLDPLTWINHLHWEHLRTEYPERRPLSFSRWGGLGSGRYPVGFSGDTFVSWKSLQFLPFFTATANNVLYGYWSHDIGGHFYGEIDGELYTRWMQFGIYSPVLRTHATKFTTNDRQFWEFGLPYSRIMKDLVRERYRLVPYLYSEARRCVDSGVSVCRPMYIEHPETEAAYQQPQQYYFGDSLIVAPVTAPRDPYDLQAEQRCWLPPGKWFDRALGAFFEGDATITRRYLLEETPTFARAGTVLPGQGPVRHLSAASYPHLLFEIVPQGSGSYEIFEDDGRSHDYLSGVGAYIAANYEDLSDGGKFTLSLSRGRHIGFVAERRVTVRVRSILPPMEVYVDGRAIGWSYRDRTGSDPYWRYDGASHTLIVELPICVLTAGVTVRYIAAPQVSNVSVNGLKGVYARLFHAFDAGRLVELPWEREIALAAQTGNRISRRPQTAAGEIAVLRDRIEALISDEEGARRKVMSMKKYRERRIQGWARASALLHSVYSLMGILIDGRSR